MDDSDVDADTVADAEDFGPQKLNIWNENVYTFLKVIYQKFRMVILQVNLDTVTVYGIIERTT